MTKTVSLGMDEWNPFEEDTFGNETEDSIFGKEFDKLRRGSNSSKYLWCIFMNSPGPAFTKLFRFRIKIRLKFPLKIISGLFPIICSKLNLCIL